MKRALGVLGLFIAAGCSSGPGAPGGAGETTSGLTYRISESKTELRIEAVDARSVVVGDVVLRQGMFSIMDVPEPVAARELVVRVGAKTARHVSQLDNPVNLPTIGDVDEDLFLRQTEVASALARWDVRLQPVSGEFQSRPDALAAGETPYCEDGCCIQTLGYEGSGCGACTHTGCGTSAATNCKAWSPGDGNEYEFKLCFDVSQLVKRSCTASGASACGTNGPSGCAVCWGQGFNDWCLNTVGDSGSGSHACYYNIHS